MKTLKKGLLKNINHFSGETEERKLNYFTAVISELVYYPLGLFN